MSVQTEQLERLYAAVAKLPRAYFDDGGGRLVYHGDCRELLPLIEPGSVDLVLTDPPYELKTASGNKGCFAKSYSKVTSKELQAISGGFEVEIFLDECRRLLKTVSLFVFCSNSQIPKIMDAAYRREWSPTVLVWHKYNSVPFSFGTWRQDAEFVIHVKANGAPMNGNANLKSKVKRLPLVHDDAHPTVKPAELVRDYITIGSNEGAIVLDPYAGSGTTGVACKLLGRSCIMFEIEERYAAIAAKRLRQEVLF